MTNGSKANKTGHVAEQAVACLLREHKIKFKHHSVVGKTIYGTPLKCDFVLEKLKILIEVKWQQSAGSVDEKYPFTVACLKLQKDYRSIIVVDGGNQRAAAIEWLKKQIDDTLIGVYSVSEFIVFLNNGELK